MKLLIKYFSMIIALMFIFGACSNELFYDQDSEFGPTNIQKVGVKTDATPWCVSKEVQFLAGQSMDAGLIIVGNDDENVFVKFTTKDNWVMTKTHLYIGNVKPETHAPGQWNTEVIQNRATEYTYVIPRENLNECFFVSAHADVSQVNEKGELYNGQTASGKGERIADNGGNWFMYFDACIKTCVYYGEIKVEKTVNGVNIHAWGAVTGTKNFATLISFNLYKTTENGGAKGELVASGTVDGQGILTFSNLPDGWYIVEEVLTAAGKEVFLQAPPMYVQVVQTKVFETEIYFDYDVLYTIFNGYGSGYTLGYPGLNNNGDIFPIAVINANNGVSYPSFCGNAGSVSFAEGPGKYMIAERIDRNNAAYGDFVKAYNYIEDKYGDLNEYRPVTQIITWYLLGAIDINSATFANINWEQIASGTWAVGGVPGAKAIVKDVAANYQNYVFTEKSKIVDVVYMVSKDKPEDYINGQPQYVPIYGHNIPNFKNTAKPKKTVAYGTVTATNFGNVPAILAGLNPKNGNPLWDSKNPDDPKKTTPFVVPNANHFVFAKVKRTELEKGVKLELLNGNKYDIVGTGFIQLVNGKIVLTIDRYAGGTFGVVAFNKLPVFNNGNIHSQKEADLIKAGAAAGFKHGNVYEFACPAGNDLWLYFHSGDLQFYL